MKYLMICEKPSLAREIQSCYQNHRDEVEKRVGEIEFLALAGHVCTSYEPNDYSEWKGKKWREVNYPMVPDKWQVKAIDDKRKKENYQTR